MTVCYPQIITARICSRSELDFSLAPPDCVRVVPVYNDASYVISQFPPPVHFLVRDNGQVYQLADIQSPPSTPPEYHAILDATGCILIGVELSAVTTVPLTNTQVSVLPGVLRHVLQTLGLSLNDVTNTLPPQRCRPQLWQQILADTTDCLNTSPPPPPPPPGLSCSFVLSCISPGQNVDISTNGIISAGQLVPGPDAGQYTWLSPDGTALFTFDTSAASLAVQDTPTVDLTLAAGNVLSADVRVSGQAGNTIQILPDGLYIASTSGPCLNNPPNLVNFPTIGLLATYNANTGCLEQIAIPSERIVYGEPSGNGSPRADNLLYSPTDNFLRATAGPDFPMQHSFMLYGPNINVFDPLGIGIYSLIGAITNSDLFGSRVSFVNVSDTREIVAINSVVVGQNQFAPSSFSRESVLLFQDARTDTAFNSFVAANEAAMPYIGFSFVSSGFGARHTSSIFASLSITLSGEYPSIDFSTHIARETTLGQGGASIGFSNAILSNVRLDGARIFYSTVHLADVTLTNVRENDFSFIAANGMTLGDIQYSFFASNVNRNQAPRAFHSFVSMEQQNSNRIGSATPIINHSVVTTVDALPEAFNALFINADANRWLVARDSVYVARNVAVFINAPNNTATLSNSLIVGEGHNVLDIQNVDSLTLIGRNLRAGINTIFGVGFNAYAPPAVQAAGGWRVFIADGGADNANYFQGWASAWRFRLFNPSIVYADTNAAIAALNAAYGADPRIDIGTMVVARVAVPGFPPVPAIFAWNGISFVRITT